MSEQPRLAEKAAFFESLRLLPDEDFDEEEEEYRERCRRFFRPRTIEPTRLELGITAAESVSHETPQKISSAPSKADAEGAGGVVKGTPAGVARNKGGLSRPLAQGESLGGDSPDMVPDSVRPRSKTLQRKDSMPAPPARKRPWTSEGTPSRPGVSKKKKKDELNMRPEKRQIFKGLRLYYIPDNDIAPARKMRITRAREFGAEWVRDVRPATHIIVDKGIRYSEVEKIVSGAKGAVVVNEDYPIDCMQFRTILSHEQKKYLLEGQTLGTKEATLPLVSSAESTKSLQLKEPQRNSRKWDYVPLRETPQRSEGSSQQPGDEAPVEASQAPMARLGDRVTSPIEIPLDVVECTGETTKPTKGKGVVCEDELSQYINMMHEFKDLPLDDEDDIDSSTLPSEQYDHASSQLSSDGERTLQKRKHKLRKPRADSKETPWENRFACNLAGARNASSMNPNTRTMEVLQRMASYYDQVGDHWRTLAYRRAITQLRNVTDHCVSTEEQALQLPGIGTSLAQKIEEIVTTDRLQRLEYAEADPAGKALRLFTGIYGVGASLAQGWVARGLRTLKDVREKVKLTPNQTIGLDHYDDLNTRIPRTEVEALGEVVKKEAQRIDAGVELIIGGSFRRGADSSGDIDFLVTKPGTDSCADLRPFLDELVRRLEASGFLVARLASSRSASDPGSKWHGCCVLPSTTKPVWRRIDFLLVPATELGAALLYFTGNDIFNRSMRLLASKKKMRLNQRGLYKDVMRGPGREKLTEGQLVEGRDEKRIFEVLGVAWREPHERWC